MDFDAVIVGAGHNALAAAVHLASRGWSVGAFERNDAAGGAVRTEEVTLPGFRHDLYAMNLSLFAGSPFLGSMAGLRAHGLPLHRQHCSPRRCARARVRRVQELPTTLARRQFRIKMQRPGRDAEKFGADAPHIFSLLGSP